MFDPAAAVAALDRIIEEQLGAILEHPKLVALERAWRSVDFLIERIDWSKNIQLAIVHGTKAELAADFSAGGDAMMGWCHRDTYGVAGGEPYGLMVCDWEIDDSDADVALAAACAKVGEACHMPVLMGAAGSAEEVNRDLREQSHARFLGLCMPRMQLRPGLWGNTAIALASRCADSFARYAWCPNITGPVDGRVAGVTTDRAFDEETEFHLSEAGYICLFALPDGDAVFYAARSVQRPELFEQSEEGRQRELNARLMSELPFLFVPCRFAQYVKVVARDNADLWHTATELQTGVNGWLAGYEADADVVTPETRGRRPLRKARVMLTDEGGAARFHLQMRPHFKYMGAFFTLGVHGFLRPTAPSLVLDLPSQAPTVSFDDACAAFAPGGGLLVATRAGEVSRFDLEGRRREPLFDGAGDVQRLALDAEALTLGVFGGNADVLQQVVRRRYDGTPIAAHDVAPRPTVMLFDARHVLWMRYRYENGSIRTLMLLDTHTGETRLVDRREFRAATLDHDAQRVAVCRREGHLEVRSLAEPQRVTKLRGHGASALAFSPDGHTLASGTGALHLWSLRDGNVRTFHADGEPITAITFSRHEPLIACATRRQVQVWNLDGELVSLHSSPNDTVRRLDFSPDGWLLGEAWRAVVHLWQLSY